MDEASIKEIIRRIERLEAAVFASAKLAKSKRELSKHKGATGGIRLLIDEGFFSKKRSFGDICDAAATRGYHYSRQAFHEALTRLATKEKSLVMLTEGGKKVYAIRR